MDLSFNRLNQLVFGYWHAQTLFCLTESAVFDALDGKPTDADELATACGLARDAGEALFDAGVALGLLVKEAGVYANSPLADALLVRGRDGSLANWVRVMSRWAEPWTHLREALETGRPTEDQALRLGEDPDYSEQFIMGMHEYGARGSAAFAKSLDLDSTHSLLDVGGGAGTYTIALCRHAPQLKAVVIDLEPVLQITRRVIGQEGLSDQVTTASLDYRADAFGKDADMVLFSNVLHQESRSVGLDMLQRGHEALRSGGQVVVHGHFLDEDRVAPVFAALHNLSARVLWEGGHSYTVAGMTGLLGAAGFEDVTCRQVGATTVLVGRKPL